MSKTYRQNDSRWGGLVYTRGGSTMAHAGCGPTSMAEIIVNNPKYASADPRTTRKWLREHGYNIGGTTWDGIRKGLEHFGFKVASPETMGRCFELLGKGIYKWGIINFRAGSRGGVTWTGGGHYVAFSDYKKVGGKHYLYTRDPGARHNDGWHCYETTMRGLIKKIWICYLPEQKKNTYTGTIPKPTLKKGNKGTRVKQMQNFLNWCGAGLVVDGLFGKKTDAALRAFQKKEGLYIDGIYGPKTYAQAVKRSRG